MPRWRKRMQIRVQQLFHQSTFDDIFIKIEMLGYSTGQEKKKKQECENVWQ